MTETRKPTLLVDARPLADPHAGGVRRVAEQILLALIKRDVADWTFVTTGSRIPGLPAIFQNRIEHVHIKWPNKLWTAATSFGTVSLDRATRRITGRTYDAAILPNLGFSGYMEIPYALVLHDLSFLIEPSWFRNTSRLWHRAVNVREQTRRANRIFCVSETTARDATRLLDIPKDKLEVFHPGIPPLPAPSPMGHAPSAPYVMTLNERDPRKNIGTAIETVHALRKEEVFRDLELVIAGCGREGTEEGIRRLGRISDAELAELYASASAFLYPSWYEGFGLPLHEAARFGIPCLASAHGSLPETVPAGTLLLPPMKPHLWISMLRDVLRNPSAYRTVFDEDLEETTVQGFIQWIQRVSRQ
ncbi:glycosyltransferase family 4 protein [candidate division WWE3 bacterium]|uniref:Glycosyltransferase family 4 protein n=1 Tax=candidate division WWE3 bacterium TaxID=2053526 RepID=A0A928Y5H1_UNCKA|nr:glycosyltransferase family 4 protein [candidate division WWE3 bacterium]